jgi:hypothetical protein
MTTETKLFEIVEKIRAWDPEEENVKTLLDLCNEFDEEKPEMGISLDDYTDITQFGVAKEFRDRVDHKSSYPIWACDFAGNCIVGEGKWSIEHIDDIEEEN